MCPSCSASSANQSSNDPSIFGGADNRWSLVPTGSMSCIPNGRALNPSVNPICTGCLDVAFTRSRFTDACITKRLMLYVPSCGTGTGSRGACHASGTDFHASALRCGWSSAAL